MIMKTKLKLILVIMVQILIQMISSL